VFVVGPLVARNEKDPYHFVVGIKCGERLCCACPAFLQSVSPGRRVSSRRSQNRHTFPTLGKAWESKPKHSGLVFVPQHASLPPFPKARAFEQTGAGRGETQAPKLKNKCGFLFSCVQLVWFHKTNTNNTRQKHTCKYKTSMACLRTKTRKRDTNRHTQHTTKNKNQKEHTQHTRVPFCVCRTKLVARFLINWNAVRCVSKSSHKQKEHKQTNKQTTTDKQKLFVTSWSCFRKSRARVETQNTKHKQTKTPQARESPTITTNQLDPGIGAPTRKQTIKPNTNKQNTQQ